MCAWSHIRLCKFFCNFTVSAPLGLVCTSHSQGFLPLTCFSHISVWPCEPVKSVDVTGDSSVIHCWKSTEINRKNQAEDGKNTTSSFSHSCCTVSLYKLWHTVAGLSKNYASQGKVKKNNLVIRYLSVDCMNTQLEVEAPVPSVVQHTKKIIYLISLVTAGAIIYLIQRDF